MGLAVAADQLALRGQEHHRIVQQILDRRVAFGHTGDDGELQLPGERRQTRRGRARHRLGELEHARTERVEIVAEVDHLGQAGDRGPSGERAEQRFDLVEVRRPVAGPAGHLHQPDRDPVVSAHRGPIPGRAHLT